MDTPRIRFRSWRTWARVISVGLVVALAGGVVMVSRREAQRLMTNPASRCSPPRQTPADFGVSYDDVTVTTSDGLELVGWHIPSDGDALVMLQHGYKRRRSRMLDVAEMLVRRGFGVLITTVRAHDCSDGELITFGWHEMKDLRAWYDYIRADPTGARASIGIFGDSMGGALAIQFAAETPGIAAVVTSSAFASLHDTVTTSVRAFTGLPAFPFGPLMLWWAAYEWGFDTAEIDFTRWIGRISPRPILIMHGGADATVSPGSGHRLFAAAREPKELWYEPDLGHAEFRRARPREFERRVGGFFDRHLRATTRSVERAAPR